MKVTDAITRTYTCGSCGLHFVVPSLARDHESECGEVT